MMTLSRTAAWLALVCAMSLTTPTAHAAELDWSVSLGATHSDNAGRAAAAEDRVSDTRGELGLQLSYAKDEGRLNARVGTNLRYQSYFDDSYDDELVGRFNGSVTYWIAPERFSWVVQNNFGQTFIDRAAVETPDNRQNTNYFSTGPDIILRLGSRTDLSLSGRWSDVSYGTSDASNQRLTGSLGVIRRLSGTKSVSLNGAAERVEYDSLGEDIGFDRQSAFFGFEAAGARTSLNLQAGYTALHDFGDTFDGPLFELSISREMTARSTLGLRMGTNLTDSAGVFRRDQGIRTSSQDPDAGPFDENEDVPVSTEPFQSDYASLTWSVAGQRNNFSLGFDWRQEDYTSNKDGNRESLSATASFSHSLTSTVTGRLRGTWGTEDFVNTDIDYEQWSIGAGISWAFARSFALSLDVSRWDGSGDTSTGTGTRDYTENRASLRITYTPGR